MGVDTIETAGARHAAACPWCGAGTALTPMGDGLGNMTLTCTACGCKGPPMPIGDDFAEADLAAVARWSVRPTEAARLAADAVERLGRACALQLLLHGPDSSETSVPVRMGDLLQLLKAANVRLA